MPVSIDASICSRDKSYTGQITNVSAYGIGYLIISVHIDTDDFAPESMVDLNLRIPSGELLDLKCEVRWFSWDASRGYATMGIRIIDPPMEYQQFTKALAG